MKFIVINKKRLIIASTLAVLFIVISLIFSFSGVFNAFAGKSNRKLPIYSVDTEKKQIAISFDCAWGVDYTDTLLEIMEKEKVVSTFFMVEFWAEKYPEYVKKISDKGHDIGTHSTTHSYMSKLDKESIVKELTESSQAITAITGRGVELFRAPYGDYNDRLIETATELGLYTIQWDVDSLDWKNLSASSITKRVCDGVKKGSIVLFHNNGLHTAEAIREIIPKLKAEGYEFVKIADMIYRDNYYIDVNGKQIKNNEKNI